MNTDWIRGFRVFSLVCLCWIPVTAAEFHVSPAGDDQADGTQNRPFATIERAQRAVRQLVADGLESDVTVLVHGGAYSIDRALRFGPEDGGNAQFRVTYQAVDGHRPVFSGGRRIEGWTVTDEGVWETVLAEVKSGDWRFRQLYVGDRWATRARRPNEGFFRAEKVGADRRTNFQYAAGDLRPVADLDQVELVFLHDWSISRVPVQSIDEAARTLTVRGQIGGPANWAVMDWFEKQPRYFLENSGEFLDAAGQWHLDHRSGRLRYMPLDGETPDRVAVVAPRPDQLLVVRGDFENQRPVRNLHFRGLSFEHSGWATPGGVYWGRQACTYWTEGMEPGVSHLEADPAAVQFDLADGCSFRDGVVRLAGASALWLGQQCRDCTVAGTLVTDCGGNGIMVGEGQTRRVGEDVWWRNAPEQASANNSVVDCLVQRCGQELFGAVGIWVGLTGPTTIANNEVRQVPYTGVSVGWLWWNPATRPEPELTPNEQTQVIDNHLHHVMQVLSDGGGIYSLGSQPGSALRGNLIHDVSANIGRAESNGMFLDQGTGQFVIEQNVIFNIDRSPLRFHKGWVNTVRNNYLEAGDGVPPVRYNDTRQERITLDNNIVVPRGQIPADVLEEARRRTGPRPPYAEWFAKWLESEK
jgi:hypothetical protein